MDTGVPMNKRLLISLFALVFVAGLTLAAEASKDGNWVGWVTDTHCGAREGAKHADCAKKCVRDMNAKFALYVPAEKKVYVLDPQEKAAEHAGHQVKVTGSLDGDTIKVETIEMAGEQKSQ